MHYLIIEVFAIEGLDALEEMLAAELEAGRDVLNYLWSRRRREGLESRVGSSVYTK